jgi:hypothetical protein
MNVSNVIKLLTIAHPRLFDYSPIPNGLSTWHFSVDSIAEYAGKEFKVTFEEGISDRYWAYTKRIKKDGKDRVRAERQEHPGQAYGYAIAKKVFLKPYVLAPLV